MHVIVKNWITRTGALEPTPIPTRSDDKPWLQASVVSEPHIIANSIGKPKLITQLRGPDDQISRLRAGAQVFGYIPQLVLGLILVNDGQDVPDLRKRERENSAD
jgi:hypothetical protein